VFLDSSKEGNQQPHLEEKARTAVAELAQKRSGPFWACCVLILLHFAVCLKNKECWIRVPYGTIGIMNVIKWDCRSNAFLFVHFPLEVLLI